MSLFTNGHASKSENLESSLSARRKLRDYRRKGQESPVTDKSITKTTDSDNSKNLEKEKGNLSEKSQPKETTESDSPDNVMDAKHGKHESVSLPVLSDDSVVDEIPKEKERRSTRRTKNSSPVKGRQSDKSPVLSSKEKDQQKKSPRKEKRKRNIRSLSTEEGSAVEEEASVKDKSPAKMTDSENVKSLDLEKEKEKENLSEKSQPNETAESEQGKKILIDLPILSDDSDVSEKPKEKERRSTRRTKNSSPAKGRQSDKSSVLSSEEKDQQKKQPRRGKRKGNARNLSTEEHDQEEGKEAPVKDSCLTKTADNDSIKNLDIDIEKEKENLSVKSQLKDKEIAETENVICIKGYASVIVGVSDSNDKEEQKEKAKRSPRKTKNLSPVKRRQSDKSPVSSSEEKDQEKKLTRKEKRKEDMDEKISAAIKLIDSSCKDKETSIKNKRRTKSTDSASPQSSDKEKENISEESKSRETAESEDGKHETIALPVISDDSDVDEKPKGKERRSTRKTKHSSPVKGKQSDKSPVLSSEEDQEKKLLKKEKRKETVRSLSTEEEPDLEEDKETSTEDKSPTETTDLEKEKSPEKDDFFVIVESDSSEDLALAAYKNDELSKLTTLSEDSNINEKDKENEKRNKNNAKERQSRKSSVLSSSAENEQPKKVSTKQKKSDNKKSSSIEKESNLEEENSSKEKNSGKREERLSKKQNTSKITYSSGSEDEDFNIEEIQTAISRAISYDEKEDTQLKKCSVLLHDIGSLLHLYCINKLSLRNFEGNATSDEEGRKMPILNNKKKGKEVPIKGKRSAKDTEQDSEKESLSENTQSKEIVESDSSDDFIASKNKKTESSSLPVLSDDSDVSEKQKEKPKRSSRNTALSSTKDKQLNQPRKQKRNENVGSSSSEDDFVFEKIKRKKTLSSKHKQRKTAWNSDSDEDSELEETKTTSKDVSYDKEENPKLKRCFVWLHDLGPNLGSHSIDVSDTSCFTCKECHKYDEKSLRKNFNNRKKKALLYRKESSERRAESQSDDESLVSESEDKKKSSKFKSKKKTKSVSSDDTYPQSKRIRKSIDSIDDNKKGRSQKMRGKRVLENKKANLSRNQGQERSEKFRKLLREKQRLNYFDDSDSEVEAPPKKNSSGEESDWRQKEGPSVEEWYKDELENSSEDDRNEKKKEKQKKKREKIIYKEESESSDEKRRNEKKKEILQKNRERRELFEKKRKLEKQLRGKQTLDYYESSDSEDDRQNRSSKRKGSRKERKRQDDKDVSSPANTDEDVDFDPDTFLKRSFNKRIGRSQGKEKTKPMSAYEKMLEENKNKNLEFLKSLGIDEAKEGILEIINLKKKPPRPYKKRPKGVVERISTREKTHIKYGKNDLITLRNLPKEITFKKALQHENSHNKFVNDFDEILRQDCVVETSVLYDKNILKQLSSNVSLYRPGVCSIAWFPSSKNLVLAVGLSTGNLNLLNIEESNCGSHTFPIHSARISNLQFNPSNSFHLISSSYDGTISLCDMQEQKFSEIFKCPDAGCTYFDLFSPSSYLVSLRNGQIAVVDNRVRRNYQQKIHLCHDSCIQTIHVHPVDKNCFVTAGVDKKVCVWDLRRLSVTPIIENTSHKRSVNSAFFSPITGNLLLTTSWDKIVSIFDYRNMTGSDMEHKTMQFKDKKVDVLGVPNTPALVRAMWLPNSDDLFAYSVKEDLAKFQIYDKDLNVYETMMEDKKSFRYLNAFHPFKSALACVTNYIINVLT